MNEYYALGILCIAVVLCLVVTTRKDIVKNNSHANNVVGLVRAAKQWLDASTRDSNLLASLLHVSHGSAYLNAARSIMSDEDIETATGVNVSQLVTIIDRQQRAAVEKLKPVTTSRPPPFRPKTPLHRNTKGKDV
jgi:hypothetical protein